MMTSKVDVSDSRTSVILKGAMDESADFSQVLAKVSGDIEVDMDGLLRANSSGLLRWIKFVHSVNDQGGTITLKRCRTFFVDQLNMVHHLAGNSGRVLSFYAPYACEECGVEVEILLNSSEVRPSRLPVRKCSQCAEDMILDAVEDLYFQFLSLDTKAYVQLHIPCRVSSTEGGSDANLHHLTATGAVIHAPPAVGSRGDSVMVDLEGSENEPTSLQAILGYVSKPTNKGLSRVEVTWENANPSTLERFRNAVMASERRYESPALSVLARSASHREFVLRELASGDLTVQCAEALPLDSKTKLAIITEDESEMPQLEEVDAITVSVSRATDGRVMVGLRLAQPFDD